MGQNVGLKSILIEHGWNMNEDLPDGMKKVTTWKEIYNYNNCRTMIIKCYKKTIITTATI